MEPYNWVTQVKNMTHPCCDTENHSVRVCIPKVCSEPTPKDSRELLLMYAAGWGNNLIQHHNFPRTSDFPGLSAGEHGSGKIEGY